VFPPIQGAIADAAGTPVSQVVPMIGYCFVFLYALFLAEPLGKKQIHAADVESISEKKIEQIDVVEVRA